MINQVLFDDKPAVKITAIKIRESSSGKSALYDCEGDAVWVPNSVCNYNPDEQSLIILEWWYVQAVNNRLL